MELSERKREILKSVIDAYILTGEPVGSKFVVSRLRKGCSSATVRNEMSDLEEMGFLEHPHTSAGRVPTRRGYRMYVDSLMEEYRLGFEERILLNSLLNEKADDAFQMTGRMAKLLSKMTGYAVAVVTREKTGTIERFEGVFIHPGSFLLVMITSSGKAITKQLTTDFPVDQEGIALLSERLNEHLAKKELGGVTLERILALEETLGEYRSLIAGILRVIYDVMAELGREQVVVEGISNLLDYEEFTAFPGNKSLFAQLEDREELPARLGLDAGYSMRVHIGSEKEGLEGASFLTCPFRFGKKVQGAVCVIGPKRMNYAEAMARLEYLARKISAVHGFESALPMIENPETEMRE